MFGLHVNGVPVTFRMCRFYRAPCRCCSKLKVQECCARDCRLGCSVCFFLCVLCTTASVCELHTMIRKRSESIASSIRCVKERAAPHITLPLFVLGGKSCALVRCSVLRSILQFWHSQSFICDCVVCQQCACDVLKGSWNRALGPMSWYGVDIW